MDKEQEDFLQSAKAWWAVENRIKPIVEEPQQVLLMRIPMSQYEAGAQKLVGMKDTPDKQGNLYVALMQMFFEAITRLNTEITKAQHFLDYRSASPERAQRAWAKLYVEMVPKDEDPEITRKRKEDFDRLMDAMPDMDRSMVFWPPGTPMAEIRFWLLVDDQYYSVASMIIEMLEEVFRERSDYGTKKKNPGLRNADTLALPDDMGPAAMVMYNALPGQHWKLMGSIGDYLNAVGLYLQKPEVTELPEYTSMSLLKQTHPGNPATLFNPANVSLVCQGCVPHKDYTNIYNYASFGVTATKNVQRYDRAQKKNVESTITHTPLKFKFVHPENVIQIPIQEATPEIMNRKVMPKEQFDHYWQAYAEWYAKTLPIGRYSLAEITGNQPNSRAAPSSDSNSDPMDVQQASLQANDAPCVTGNIVDRNCDASDASRKQWAHIATMFGGGTVAFEKSRDLHTNRLSAFELRTRQNIIDQSGSGPSNDKIAQVIQMCEKQHQRVMEEAEAVAESLIDRRARNVAWNETEIREYGHLGTDTQIRYAVALRRAEAFQRSSMASIASLVADSGELPDTEMAYARFGARMLGKVLSDEAQFVVPIFDDQLSVFANFVAWIMQQMEDVELFSSAHVNGFISWIAKNSCLRRQLGMVFNIMIIGAAGTAKSYLLNLIERWSISGTCQVFNHISPKSLHSDTPQNSQIRLTHELTEEFMNQRNPKADSKLAADYKDMLTRGELGYNVLQLRANGGRSNRCVVTPHNSVHIMAGNLTGVNMGVPLKTRFHYISSSEVNNAYRSNKTISNMALNNGCEPASISKEQRRFRHYSRIVHFLFWLMEFAIACKILPQPTLLCTVAVVQDCSTILKKHITCEQTLSRCTDRIKIFARELVILMAIQYLYFTNIAEYRDVPFSPLQILDAGRFLVDTEEIALFTAVLISKAVENMNKIAVLKAFALDVLSRMKVPAYTEKMFKLSKAAYVPAEVYRNNVGARMNEQRGVTSPGAREQNAPLVNLPTGAPRVNGGMQEVYGSDAAAESMRAQRVAYARSLMPGMTQDTADKIARNEYDFSYLYVKDKPHKYAMVLRQIMEDNPDKFSELIAVEQIHEVLVETSREVSRMPQFNQGSAEKIDILCGKKPPQQAEKDLDSMVHEIEVTESGMFVHYRLFQQAKAWLTMDSNSAMENEIAKLQNEFTRDRRIMIGTTVPEAPFAFKTVEIKKREKKMVIENPFRRLNASTQLLNKSYKGGKAPPSNGDRIHANDEELCRPLEDQCMLRHMLAMHVLTDDDAVLESVSIRKLDEEIIAAARTEESIASGKDEKDVKFMRYPEDMLAEIRKRVARENEVHAAESRNTEKEEIAAPVQKAAPEKREPCKNSDIEALRVFKKRRVSVVNAN